MTTTTLTRTTGKLIAPQLDYILLDGSGSMQSKWFDTLAAIDNYMDVLKSANLNAQCILCTFDTIGGNQEQRDLPLRDWTPLSQIGAHWGATPLYDAINSMGRRLKELDPARCHVIIATDGQETSSTTTVHQAKAILDWCRAKGWQITFLGADFNNFSQAKALGSPNESVVGVQRRLLSEAAKSLGEKRVRHGRTGDPIHFTEAEQIQFGGHLGGPTAS